VVSLAWQRLPCPTDGTVRLTGLGCSVAWCGWVRLGFVDATPPSLYKCYPVDR
jgi:hypothetical protein